MLEGAPATHPLYHRGPCQARMKLCSDYKTCTDELFKLLTFNKFLVRPHIENKWTVGFTKHRLDLIDADVTVFSSLILCQGNFPINGDYSFDRIAIASWLPIRLMTLGRWDSSPDGSFLVEKFIDLW